MRSLLSKNIIAHRSRNQLTSNIYALTLGCIIFLIVSANLQIQSISQLSSYSGSDIVAISDSEAIKKRDFDNVLFPAQVDQVLLKYQDSIKEFSYVTQELNFQLPGEDGICQVEDQTSAFKKARVTMYAINPSEQVDNSLVVGYNSRESMGLTESLYTARGDQGMGTTQYLLDFAGVVVDDDSYASLLKWYYSSKERRFFGKRQSFQLKRTLFTLRQTPAAFHLDALNKRWMMISYPQYTFLAEKTTDEVALQTVMIWVKDKNDKELIQRIAQDLRAAIPETCEVKMTYKDDESNESVLKIIDMVFYVTIGIMMFLCFFSLVASMTANLYDQQKEIAVLRSIGITSYRIKLLYFYEAAILVLSSCLLGIVIGMTVGYTMMLQQNMFMNTKMEAYFPALQVMQITVLSLLCAFFAT